MTPARRAILLAAFLALALSLLAWPAQTYGTDPLAYREEARALLLGRLHVDPPPPSGRFSRPGDYFVPNPRDGHWYSKYGTFNAIASLPPLAAERLVTGALPPFDSPSRLAFLNAWNSVLTALLAALLVRLALLYTPRPGVAILFSLSCLLATFLWHYTRAQASELPQAILAVLAFDSATRHVRAPARRHAVVLWLSVAALVFSRVAFLPLVPVAAAVTFIASAAPARRRTYASLAPAVVVVAALLLLNFAKFGSPTSTGYHAFEPEKHLPTLDPREGLAGFLVSPHKAVWWHFPVLVLALPAWPAFYLRYRTEARVLLVASGLYFLPLCTVPSWAGEWSLGPRYLLAGLPLLALPAVLLPELLAGVRPLTRRLAAALAFAVLATGVYANVQLVQVGFFAAHEVRSPLRRAARIANTATAFADDRADYPGRSYWESRPHALIVRDLLATKGDIERSPLFARVVDRLTPAQLEDLRRTYRAVYGRGNSYWFSDRPS